MSPPRITGGPEGANDDLLHATESVRKVLDFLWSVPGVSIHTVEVAQRLLQHMTAMVDASQKACVHPAEHRRERLRANGSPIPWCRLCHKALG